ncbi:MAG: NAD-dependent epimerase/dehydratase family protein [Gemmatimonadota bacterium]
MPSADSLLATLSEPTSDLIADFGLLAGDLIVLGVAGKMGPSLAALARRSDQLAGGSRRIFGVARFSATGPREVLEAAGVETIAADLLDPAALAALPAAPNVVFMAGQKFGTTGNQAATWAVNTHLPGLVAERFRGSRIVVFSTGNVYPLWPVASTGPTEADAVGPIGEYAQSALGRERVFEYFSRRHGTPVATLRLNYAIEPRYGVLRDIADRVWRAEPVDLTMGWVNLIWQRDANAIALRALAHAASPPLVLNITGRPAVSVRSLAEACGHRWGKPVKWTGSEAPTALLSNAAQAEVIFGRPPVEIDAMIDHVAAWVEAGGHSLGKPTRFEEREGRF